MATQRGDGRKIRVLQITHDLNIGGLQRVVTDLATHLDRDRFQSLVCALRGGGPLAGELEASGTPLFLFHPAGRLAKYAGFRPLRRLIRRIRPDVVHTHNTLPLLDGVLASVLAGVPVRIHTDHARAFPDKRRYMVSERIASRFVHRFVAVSEHTRSALRRYERISAAKLEVIHNGIDDARLRLPADPAAVRRQVGLRDGDFPVLGLGVRLCRQKAVGDLLAALRRLVPEFPRVRLLLCGEGELEEELRAEARALGIEPHVLFLGPRTDMHRILRLLDLYVLPSIWEGLPLVLIEAMAASLPIVATDVGGNPELVEDGGNGLLVPPGNPAAICAAVTALSRDPGRREAMGRRSRARFEQHFTVARMVDKYASLYIEYAGDAPTAPRKTSTGLWA